MQVIKRTWRIFRANRKEILLFELLYRTLTVMVFVSLFTRGLLFAIKKSGYSYVTAKNLGWFLLKPWTILILTGLALLGIAFLVFEVCTLLAAFQASEREERLTMRGMVLRGLQGTKRLVIHAKAEGIITVVLLLGASNCNLVYHSLFRIKPIKDVMKYIGGITWAVPLVLGILLILALWLLSNLFSIHFCVLSKVSWKECRKQNKGFVRKKILLVLLQYIGLIAASWLLVRMVLYVLTVFVAWVVHTFVAGHIQLALFLAVYDWLDMIALVIEGIVALICHLAFLTGMYYQYRDDENMEPELLLSLEQQKLQEQRHRKTIWILTGVVCIFVAVILMDIVSNGIYYAKEVLVETQITAHRGSSYAAPENTIPALERAIEEMVDYAEIDVQQTKDGVIILLHDKSFKRTTGVSKNPWNMTYEEVLALDAGYYAGEAFYGTKVPSLEEVLQLCDGKIKLNIEIKVNGYNDTLTEDVVAMIEKYRFENQCVITSSNRSVLQQVKELNPDIPTGYILSSVYGAFYDDEAVDFFSMSSGLLNENNIAYIHESGREVHAWTVNSKTEIERMKRLGVDNIITDYPVLVREILYRAEDTESIMEFVNLVFKFK